MLLEEHKQVLRMRYLLSPGDEATLEQLEQGWHHYQWVGDRWSGDIHYFTHMYAARYCDALDVARRNSTPTACTYASCAPRAAL
jgi:hypothetical protein